MEESKKKRVFKIAVNRASNATLATWEVIVLYVQKVGTILADRRFYAAAVPVVLAVLGVAGVNDDTIAKIKELVGEDGAALATFFAAFTPALIALISSIALNSSWTKRAPSGLGYKKLLDAPGNEQAWKDAFCYVVELASKAINTQEPPKP